VSQLWLRVQEAIRAKQLLPKGESVLVAVSGGLDSMVLLHVLQRLMPRNDWRLVVAHFNHQLRGRSSDVDERFVRKVAKRLGLEFVSGHSDVRKYATAGKLSVEMAARELRHEFLAREAARRKIRVVALAHHADDQVENFFLRLLRGSGSESLAGMKWKNASPANANILLVRPFLGEPKADLKAWAEKEGIQHREDATNARLEPRRNRIRHELLPLLVREYQPALARVITRQMDILAAEADFLNGAASSWSKSRSRQKFEALPIALQRRRLWLELLRQNVAANFEMIETLREFENCPVAVDPKTSVQRDNRGNIKVARRERGNVGFNGAQVCQELKGRAGEFKFGNVRFRWKRGPIRRGIGNAWEKQVNYERFDADKVGAAIRLRHWRPGDRFQPIGMPKAAKLQDLFTNQKVPRAKRKELVVATTDSGELFWVEGVRLGERFKLDKSTLRGLKWRWNRL
jgi:tRNA(Ile)-lysidine synthase